MSQSKVDKRKYEKKNRAAIMKREKRKKILGWCIFGVLVGCILAATLGVKIYKAIPKYVEVFYEKALCLSTSENISERDNGLACLLVLWNNKPLEKYRDDIVTVFWKNDITASSVS